MTPNPRSPIPDPRPPIPDPSSIWINGQRQLTGAPHVSARDRGLTLADGVFETMRVHAGRVFRLDGHLERLVHALSTLDIPVPSELRTWVLDAVRAAGADDLSVRLTVTRGMGPAGVAPPIDADPTVVVAINPPPVFPATIYDAGLTVHVASGRRNEHAMTAGLKTLAYTDAVAALIEARRAGADEALFLDTEGHCSEATSSNVFVWKDGTLLTPPVSCGALPGITRGAVLALAASVGVRAVEHVVERDALLAAEEVFLTSSLRGIAPLVRVDAHRIGRGAPGRVTRQFIEAYRALVLRECSSQPARG